jgi:hypothetical protein
VLFRKSGGNPDNGDCLKSGGICEQLSKVRVVGTLKLIFDQNPRIAANILAKNIGAEWPYRLFLSLKLKFQAKRFAKCKQVFFTRQPWRKVGRLTEPNVTKLDLNKLTEIICIHFVPLLRPGIAPKFKMNRGNGRPLQNSLGRR